MSEFYKTNDDSLSITEEFVNEWYNKQEYMLVDIRESEERTEKGIVKGTYNISMYEIPDQIDIGSYLYYLFDALPRWYKSRTSNKVH